MRAAGRGMIGLAEVACLEHTFARNHCVAHDTGLLCRRLPSFHMLLLIVHAELIQTRPFVGLFTCNSPYCFPVMGHAGPANWDIVSK